MTPSQRTATLRALSLQPEALGPRWPQTVARLMTGRLDEAVALGEQVVARARAPVFVGVMGMVYARAGRLAEALQLSRESHDRSARGEFVSPVARLVLQLGLGAEGGIVPWLDACADGGAGP